MTELFTERVTCVPVITGFQYVTGLVTVRRDCEPTPSAKS
jgi:hypothetical protein